MVSYDAGNAILIAGTRLVGTDVSPSAASVVLDFWWGDVGKLCDRQAEDGDGPNQHQNDRDDDGHDRPFDEEL